MTSSQPEFVVQFWGVRGSVPCPGPETVRYGGNTSCIEIRVAGHRLIFDAGTGLRNLSKQLESNRPVKTHLFFTHYHWDHIQGLPFFMPLFMPDSQITICGQVPEEVRPLNLEQHFLQRVLHTNSPVPIQNINAQLHFQELNCGDSFGFEGIAIRTQPLNHPNGAMGYRVEWQGHSIVYCTDTEHFPDRLDEAVLNLAQGADMLIYDAMYTDEEYHNPKSPKVGWGHSTWQEGVRVAEAAGVKTLVVFHHEPNHSDETMDRIGETVRARFPGAVLAREGLILSVLDG